ncbi:hypothetical protein SUGI_1340610 [Cryptomeria japonica]|uniref:Receptor-like serine/threonine-protein kinase n=2 Tax=Cryptomeria japonica TaxID=3369 RepID=A0AAD3NPS4_CRYJA|nr:hypothetical protein SUGI_1340610 [Cryptomeria japonica]
MISALSVLIIICYGDGLSTGTGSRDSLSLGASLIGNQTITSKNGMFELGIFSPNGSNNWYLGIWYANIPEKMVVWVANRENPGKHRPGVLKLSKGGTLGLFDAGGMSLWSANVSYKPSRAVLLDSGKASLLEKLYGSRTWAFVLHLDPSGAKQFVLTWNNSVQFWESGNWDNKTFSGMPENPNRDRFNVSFKSTSSGFYFSYELQTGIPSLIKINSGGIQEFALYDNTKWIMVEIRPRDQCAAYGFCGPCGSCNSNNLEFCSCVEGFIPADKRARDSQDWSSSGCVRQSPLNCDTKKGSTDEFIEAGVTLPDDSASSYSAPNKGDCQKACLRNCSCTAFAFNSPSGRCQIWSGDLLNMNNSPSNRRGNVSIRVAALKVPKHKKWSSSQLKTIIIVSALALTVALSIISFLMWQRCRLRPPKETCAVSSEYFLRMFSYIELKIATRNFRSKLGSGGFGSVFKGCLTDGTLVAVKKLDSSSRQHDKQFRAEISSLGNIQHANLIRLRGICAEGSKRLLVYDYMPNGSLNSLLFTNNSKSKPKVLDWKTRFQIALGTARGLVYLHEECRDCVIHSDVKPKNILLDGNFSPKLADFGLAKLVGRDFSRVLTTTRGTRGYLAPEWISGLPITPKVDVYSFGMTLLEIISGRRSLDLSVQDSSQYYFPAWAAAQIYEGKMINIVDERVAAEADVEEVRRAGIVGLLCIEREEERRPSMEQVLRMLEGKMEPPTPQMPSSAVRETQAYRSNTDSDGNDIVDCGLLE